MLYSKTLLFMCISFFCMHSFALSNEMANQLDKQSEQINQQHEKIQSLEKDLAIVKETSALNINNQDKRISDLNITLTAQSNHIASIGNYISWTSLALGVIAALAGVGVFVSAKSRAREAAEQWINENNHNLLKKLNELETKAHTASSQMDATVGEVEAKAQEKAKQIEAAGSSILNNSSSNTSADRKAAETIAKIDSELKDKPENSFSSEDYYVRGLSFYNKNEKKAALEYFLKAAESVKKGNASLVSRFWFATALAQSEIDPKNPEIATYYNRAIEADPKYATALGNYAIFLTEVRKDHDAAEAMYKRAFEADPKYATALGNYANFLTLVRKDHDTAEAMYKRAIEADPKDAPALGNYAIFLTDVRKDHDAAEAMYKRAIEADPKYAPALGSYANFLTDVLKDHDAAEAMFKRAIEADPKDANNLGNFSKLLFIKQSVDEAKTMLSKALTLSEKDNPSALDAECWMYAYCCIPNEYPDALSKLKKLILEYKVRTGEWDFSEIIAIAKKQQHKELKHLGNLAEVLAEKQESSALENWSAWQSA